MVSYAGGSRGSRRAWRQRWRRTAIGRLLHRTRRMSAALRWQRCVASGRIANGSPGCGQSSNASGRMTRISTLCTEGRHTPLQDQATPKPNTCDAQPDRRPHSLERRRSCFPQGTAGTVQLTDDLRKWRRAFGGVDDHCPGLRENLGRRNRERSSAADEPLHRSPPDYVPAHGDWCLLTRSPRAPVAQLDRASPSNPGSQVRASSSPAARHL